MPVAGGAGAPALHVVAGQESHIGLQIVGADGVATRGKVRVLRRHDHDHDHDSWYGNPERPPCAHGVHSIATPVR